MPKKPTSCSYMSSRWNPSGGGGGPKELRAAAAAGKVDGADDGHREGRRCFWGARFWDLMRMRDDGGRQCNRG